MKPKTAWRIDDREARKHEPRTPSPSDRRRMQGDGKPRMTCDQCGAVEPKEYRGRFSVCYRPETKDPVFFCSKTCLEKLVESGVVKPTDGPIFGGP